MLSELFGTFLSIIVQGPCRASLVWHPRKWVTHHPHYTLQEKNQTVQTTFVFSSQIFLLYASDATPQHAYAVAVAVASDNLTTLNKYQRFAPTAQKKKEGMETEAKANFLCIYLIPCWASCFASVDLEDTIEFVLFFQIDEGKINSQRGKELNKICPPPPPPNRRDDLCL